MYKFEKAYEFINLEYSFKQEVYYEKHRWAQLDKITILLSRIWDESNFVEVKEIIF